MSRRLIVSAASLFVLAGLVMTVMLLRKPPGYATGDPLPVRLIGTQPAGSQYLLDPSGATIAETLDDPLARGHDPATFYTTVVFEVPKADGDFVALDRVLGCASDNRQHAFIGFTDAYAAPSAGNRFRVGMAAPLKYRRGKVFNSQRALERIDVTFVCWFGPRTDAPLTFLGPFSPGAHVASTGAAQGTLRLAEWYEPGMRHSGIEGRVTLSIHAKDDCHILVYDAAGRRRLARALPPHYSRGRDVFFRIENLSLKDVAAVTVDEEPRRATFHNIRAVQKPGEPPWLREMARRLGKADVPDKDLRSIRLDSPQEMLAVMDVVRGARADEVGRRFSRLAAEGDPLYFTPEQAVRARAAADSWSGADNLRIRARGIVLGLALDFPAFADRALDLIEAAGGFGRYDVIRTLGHGAAAMTAPQVARLRDIALVSRAPGLSGVIELLDSCPLPDAARALAALFASDRPELWYYAARSPRLVEALGPVEKWPVDLRARHLLAVRRDAIASADKETLAAAARLLPQALAPRLLDADWVVFQSLYSTMEGICGPRETETFVLDFLAAARVHTAISAVMVRDLNRWRGIDIGGLGASTNPPDESRLRLDAFRPWPRIVADALEWHRTGVVPPDPFDGYRASHGDVRVILTPIGDPESSVICLCPKPLPYQPQSMSSIGSNSSLIMACSMRLYDPSVPDDSPRPGPSRGTLDFEINGTLSAANAGGFHLRAGYASLPYTLDPASFGPKSNLSITAEPADSPQSVISDTAVFKSWWSAHGPEAAAPLDSTVSH